MVTVNNLPIGIQAKIAEEFHMDRGYLAPNELVTWLNSKGYNLHLFTGLDGGPCYSFNTEEEYAMFLLRWA